MDKMYHEQFNSLDPQKSQKSIQESEPHMQIHSFDIQISTELLYNDILVHDLNSV